MVLHAVAVSRYSGRWIDLKIVADTADASATVHSAIAVDVPSVLDRTERHAPLVLLASTNLEAEYGARST
jgi:indolepyruvate ferredoxin oxidoreductase